jgi:predicted nucleic-acid-binding Zn-ribbon protein
MDTNERQAVRDAALKHIQKYWEKPYVCPICANEDWAIGNPWQAPLREGGTPIDYLGSFEVYVFVPVSCTKCGYTRLFNAVQAGIEQPSPSDLEGEPMQEHGQPG